MRQACWLLFRLIPHMVELVLLSLFEERFSRERYVKHRFYSGAGAGRLPGVVEFC